MKITTYRYEKVPVESTEIFIPQETFYCFQTFVRRAIKIVPTFIKWDCPEKGDVYELEVTCVYSSFEAKIEKFNVRISQMEDHINREEKSNKASITRMLLEDDFYIRTKEQFDADFESIILKFNS